MQHMAFFGFNRSGTHALSVSSTMLKSTRTETAVDFKNVASVAIVSVVYSRDGALLMTRWPHIGPDEQSNCLMVNS